MSALSVSLAYKFVAMVLMLAEANFFCANTGLLKEQILTQSDVRSGGHVGPFNPRDFSGSIVTDQYLFGFGWGHLANFRKRGFMPQGPDSAIKQRNLELSKLSSSIDSGESYELATKWLAALGVDTSLLEKKYRRALVQWKYFPDGVDGKAVMLPVYQLEWRGSILRSRPDRERPVVSVTIFGATKELVELHVLDDSLFSRPRIEIRNTEKLLSLPDAQFASYAFLQKSNLVRESVTPPWNSLFSRVLERKSTNQMTRITAPRANTSNGPMPLPSEIHRLPPASTLKRQPP